MTHTLEDTHRYDPPPDDDLEERLREHEVAREAEDDFRLHQRYEREIGDR
jgi:hypothetical protein